MVLHVLLAVPVFLFEHCLGVLGWDEMHHIFFFPLRLMELFLFYYLTSLQLTAWFL